MKFPSTLGACLDKLYTLRQSRLKLEAEASEIKDGEVELKKHVLRVFKQKEINGARGAIAVCSTVPKLIPMVDDEKGGWEALQQYIAKEGAFELLNRALNRKAYAEAVENGISIPGLRTELVIDLSVRKAGRGKVKNGK